MRPEAMDWVRLLLFGARRAWFGGFNAGGRAVPPAGQLRQLVEDSSRTQPAGIFRGGIAADGGAGGDVVGDAALRGGYDAVADGEVAGDADLPGEDDVVPDLGGTGKADLRAQQ